MKNNNQNKNFKINLELLEALKSDIERVVNNIKENKDKQFNEADYKRICSYMKLIADNTGNLNIMFF